jgi:hypothetical protein
VGYRDELEAAQARCQALERELADARREIAELEGESAALVPVGDTALATSQPPDKPERFVRFERTLPGRLSEESLAEIAEHLSESTEYPTSELTALVGSVLWKGSSGSYVHTARVSSRRGEVVVRMEADVAAMAVGAGFVGLVGGGATSGLIGALGAASALFPPALALVPLVPITWWAKRRLHRRWYRKQVERSRRRFEEVVALVEKLIEDAEDPDSENAEADPGGPAS